ncbi:MAG: N-acetyl-gamma-glutamyl-phosphate reductase [Gammaproteobacteria bacterium]|nr:N-acetyl-gamma-glutamyl-phosphate reductase [Gammaproteobacteria bacterium]MDH5800850.1 N-acetyl-gamma-glutamyl-phosphate reductase [Gammaproteobacteria bacterium]
MIKVGIVGGTGYTGVELLRLLVQHPQVHLHTITSRTEAGMAVADMFPNLRGHTELCFSEPDTAVLSECDLVFFATPNGVAMKSVPELLQAGVRVIDLAADFRLKNETEWEQWYGMPHACPQLLEQAVYGLPELNRSDIVNARLIANPGCYPTSVQLGFAPLLRHGLVDTDRLIADCKSGVSGAGRKASVAHLLGECSESFKAYSVAGHRHLPEITQGLRSLTDNTVSLTFVPHLTPMLRGIHASLYAYCEDLSVDLQAIYAEYFASEVFVDVMPAGSHPETRSVRGSNTCRIAVHRPQQGNMVVILSIIDNLTKGAAGQAVQNMNIMFGFDEAAGLNQVALLP